jgi:hypothetical protein
MATTPPTYQFAFNGGNANYDGFGHSTHDNNTLFLYLWTAI